jgi:hypothetical protein
MIMTPELNEELWRDIEALLPQIGIANSYGWQNADDADPEFIGHAMWQTNAPLDDFFDAESDGDAGPAALDRDTSVQKLGIEAFTDLMVKHGRKQKIESAWD